MTIHQSVLELVGDTPVVQAQRLDTGPCTLFLKLESQNPGGSIKDRIGLSMIEAAEKRGDIRPGDTLVEGTAGNTGIGLALVAQQKGYKLLLVVPDKMSREKIFNLKAMGAQVVLTRSDVAKGHPDYYQDMAARIARETPGAYFINQFGNPDNPAAHEYGTGPEILRQMDGRLDAIVFGCGSSGTMTGLSRCFAKESPATELVLADPVGSILEDYINRGQVVEKSASWMVEGIGEDFLPPISDFTRVKKAYAISDRESFLTARELLEKEGILGGSSTGTLLAAALRYCREQKEPKRVVTLACDTGSRYLSKLFNDFWMEDQGFTQRENYGDLRDLVGRPHGQRATITVGPDDALTTAHNRLRNAGFSQLPVMEDDQLIGVVTEDDILRFAFGRPECFNEPVRHAMTKAFLRIDKDTSVNNLVAMLEVRSSAAVMDGERFLGLITRSDVLNYLRRQMK